ncbi:MAG TPA: hypothetical protein PKM21_08840 [Anaerolineales bacterium]|nr:hypothetical protein [Anaerolineales bacterium]
MDKKQTGIIATVAASLLCGCPGLSALCFGAFFAVISQIPGAEIDVFGSNDPTTALTTGLGMVCGGLIFVIIPIVIGFVMLRKKPGETPVSNEPLPPAI